MAMSPLPTPSHARIRALGELGRLDEMVQIYQKAARQLPLGSRRECMLFVLAFTGRVERVQPLLDRPSFAIDDDSKTYWMGVARLRRDIHDEAARSMLRRLAETRYTRWRTAECRPAVATSRLRNQAVDLPHRGVRACHRRHETDRWLALA